MNESTQGTSVLRQRMTEDMRMRKLSPKTQATYIRSVRRFAAYLSRSPDTATVEELRNYQLHLVDQGTSPITLNATITGLKFFFDVTLDRSDLTAKMKPVFVPRTVPVVLSREEVVRLISACRNLKHQTALSVALVHAPLPAARVALRLSPHPSLWITRQRQPPARYRHRSRSSASAGANASRCARRPQHGSRLRPADLRVPTLRCADARHRDLRARSAHPWPTAFIGRSMIDSGSTDRTSPAAFARTMPSRTPVALFCKTFGCCHHHRLMNARCRCILGTPPTHIDHSVPTIFASPPSAQVQIPIDLRLC
jgi:integrase